jgi:hypothetical protein
MLGSGRQLSEKPSLVAKFMPKTKKIGYFF